MNLEACMRDGMSTAGTAGAGLGAVSRLATRWDPYTRHGIGTVISAIVLPKTAPEPTLELAGVAIPYPGLHVCGDAWTSHEHGALVTVIVSDGLGHGDGAREASQSVLAAFRARPDDPLPVILDYAHGAAKSTRGAATTIVRVDRAARTATIAGVGNVAAWIVADKSRQLVTQHGTLGQATPRIREETYPFPANATLVMASDGLKSRIPFDELGELLTHSALTVATGLWRDHTRGRDDATVVVLREAR
jgi:serine/threonine protein phosphatase PrpC